jgi:hypothetical protein
VIYRPAVFDRAVLSLDIADLAQSFAKGVKPGSSDGGRRDMKKADHRHCLLLPRAASGHAAAVLARPAIRSRRRIGRRG